MNPLRAAARAYAAAGWPVFPVEPRGKRPLGRLVPHGLKQATVDPGQVERWWAAEPDANIGLRTGITFDVLDVDGDEGFGELARRIAEAGRALEPGAIAATGSGSGAHYLFTPSGHGNRAKMAPGLDWRGEGGYIVAAPSIHASGERYEWALRPKAGAVMPAPPRWLIELVDPPKMPRPPSPIPATRDTSAYVAAAVKGELEKLAATKEGGRNHALVAAATNLGTLVGAGVLERGQAEYVLEKVALAIGLEQREVTATIRSGLDFGIAHPRRIAS